VSYTDRTLTCLDCSAQFTFSAEDQEYHASRGFTNEPKRCPSCRAARRSERGEGRSYGDGYSSAPRQMHSAVCAQCGKTAEVPFEPRGDRPVYCRECFATRAPARSRY
jgi:CxxC-x17-CxxC domain-containing protein